MEDEYKVVCALSNGATFHDLESPRTPISRSKYSLKANISQTVHPIHYMFGSSPMLSGVGGANGATYERISGSLDSGAVARNPCVSWAFLLRLLKSAQAQECKL